MSEDVRLAIASQPTVRSSLVALFRALLYAGNQAMEHSNTVPLEAMIASLAPDVKSWVDAVLANTNLAIETAAPLPVPMSLGVQSAFDPPISAADKAKADKALADADAARADNLSGSAPVTTKADAKAAAKG